jgi:hypothetical protein
MTPDDGKSLSGYSDLMGFEITAERLAGLEPELRRFMRDIARLWEVDVTGVEMAVDYRPNPREW